MCVNLPFFRGGREGQKGLGQGGSRIASVELMPPPPPRHEFAVFYTEFCMGTPCFIRGDPSVFLIYKEQDLVAPLPPSSILTFSTFEHGVSPRKARAPLNGLN